MPDRPPPFDIDDTKSFEANLESFFETLEASDPVLARVLKTELTKRVATETGKTALWDALLAAASESVSS